MAHTDPGYAIFQHVFERSEMTGVLDRLSEVRLERTKAGARHVLQVPAVRQLADDGRMTEIARRFLGASAVPFRATLFDKSSSANWLVVWHQDTALPLRRRVEAPEWGPWSMKAGILYAHAPASALERVVALRISLDDSFATNGPLRVLPDSHRDGVLTDAQIERLARTVPPVDCVTKAGGVVAMRPLAVHASSKSVDDEPRRVLHIEYADSLRLFSGIELAVA
jgi:hypothetical protein